MPSEIFARRIGGMAGFAVSAVMLCGAATSAEAAPLDVVEYQASATFSNSEAAHATIAMVPIGKTLVITSVSYYRAGAPAGSIGQAFLATNVGATGGVTALPDATAGGSPYPAATLSTTLYAGTGSNVLVNFYSSALSSEADFITVSGYLIAS